MDGQKVVKGLRKLILFCADIVFAAAGGSSSSTKQYTHGEAYSLLHEDKISIAEFVESIKD